jgi:hypothetical protein
MFVRIGHDSNRPNSLLNAYGVENLEAFGTTDDAKLICAWMAPSEADCPTQIAGNRRATRVQELVGA